MIIVLQIAQNIILLSLMGLAYLFIENNHSRLGDRVSNLLVGLCFGFTAALVTVLPVTLGDGATVDARAGPVILSGVIAGPVGAVLAALLGATARSFVGGSFALSGVAVFVVYAFIGVALRYFRLATVDTLPNYRTVALVVFASLCGAASMFFLIQPFERALTWLYADLPLIFFANILSVAYAAACISLVLIYRRKVAEVIRVNEVLRIAKRAGGFGTWDFDIVTGRLDWDEVSRELHGVDDAEFKCTFDDWAKTVHPDDLERTRQQFAEALASPDDGVFDSEYRVILPDGTEHRIKSDAVVLRNARGAPIRVVGSNIDLTAIRKTESQLEEAQSVAVQAQKIETVGQLTGGIAHDFNNLLAVIMGNLELLMMKLKDGDLPAEDARRFIEDSLNAAHRGADLTRNMLAYARKAQLSPVTLDLNDVVRQTEQWIGRTIESSVRIETELENNLWLTEVDASSMQSALVNLIVNARDAVGGSGHVRIETANVVIDDQFLDHAGERPIPGEYVMVAVSDDGIGMDSNALQRVFDPFYTTKPVGEGTGLGLSTVQGFVKQSRGAIRVRSEPGRGTEFQLYFPATEGTASVTALTREATSTSERADSEAARILLVEDQRDVRTVLRRMLESAGYVVTTAASGEEAFEKSRTDDGFDLVLADIVVPGRLQGPSLARALSEQYAHMRFVFITGYDSQSSSDEQDFLPNVPRLMKPVSQRQLLDTISQSLKDPAP